MANTAALSTDESLDPSAFYRFLYFLGRFHPIVLHFPIGLLIGLLILEVITLFRPTQAEPAKSMLLILGALGSIVAAVLGLFLSWSQTFDADLVFWHQWTGIGVAVGAVLAVVMRSLMVRKRRRSYAAGYALALIATVVALGPAGHYGAALTHGPAYLVTYLPEELEFLRPILGEERVELASVPGDSYFAQTILPILQAKCLECHSGGKQDGELSMETLEYCVAGGETGKPAIVPGNAMASYMVELMLLPPADEKVMPPEGEPQLEPGELLELVRWINAGAPWGDVEIVVAAAEPSEDQSTATDTPAATIGGGSEASNGMSAQVIDTKETMKLLFEPPYLALQSGLVAEPEGRSAMRAVYEAAVSLAEAHNLMFSRVGEDYMKSEDWVRLTIAGRDASDAVGDGMQARDYAAMKSAFEHLVKTCNDCHEHFELDVDPMTVLPEGDGEAKSE